MEVEIYWSSSSCFYSDTGKRMQQVVSEPSILGGERRLESRQSDAGITENRWEAHWRRMDARLDELKKAILDLSFSTQGRSVETTDASSGSRESHVRAEAEHRSCSTDLDPTDCDLSPMQKTEEHKVRGIDSESYFLSFSRDSMNTFVGNSTGVSELSTMGDDSLIEQHSNIVEEESTMSLKDAIAIYVEEFVNSRNSSMKFDVAARESFDVKAEGLVDEEEKEVSKEVSMGEYDGKYVQMDRSFDAFLSLDSIKVPVNSQIELVKVPMTNKMMVQSPSKCGWSVPNWFAMPKVKMKTERVGIGDLMAASALMETHEFGKEMEHVVDYLANFGKGKGNSTYCAQFATSLMVHRSYCLSFKWLLDWEPKPTVKMKLMNVIIADLYHSIALSGSIISDILIANNELKDLIMSVQEDFASSGKEVLSQQPDLDAKDERSADKEETYGAISGARWAERFLLKAAFNNSPYHLFIWLLVRFPKPKVRMKLMKFASRDGYEEEFTNLDMADKKGPTEVSIAPASPNEQSPCNNEKVRLNNIASCPYILRSSHVSTTNPKVGNLFGVSGEIEVVEFLEEGDLLKSMKCRKDVILSMAQQSAPAVREEEQTAWNGEFSSMMLMLLVDQKRNDTLWMSEVNVIKTCQFSDIGWLVSIWFPKPRVKMKLGKMRHKMLGSMIPCGQGILRGMDCCNHKLRNEKRSSARNTCSFMCTTYIPAGCHVSVEI